MPPAAYTGEAFGVEYLYRQSGLELVSDSTKLDEEIDEGFEDIAEEVGHQGSLEQATTTCPPSEEDMATFGPPPFEDYDDDDDEHDVDDYDYNDGDNNQAEDEQVWSLIIFGIIVGE